MRVIIECVLKYDHSVDIDKEKLPALLVEEDFKGTLECRWYIAQPKGICLNWNVPEWLVLAVLWRSTSAIFIRQYPLLQSNVLKYDAEPRISKQSSIRGSG